MELISSTFSSSIKRNWRRRQYQRLDGSVNREDTIKIARLGGKRKRFWRIRAIRKLKLGFKIVSPIKLLAKLRDSYINMMLGVAGNVGSLNGDSFFGRKRLPKARTVEKISKAEEFETKLVYEIYKALMASRELTSH
ncbi:hypothetical protein FRX31_013025 [Thalictrum thalictroides]|uniref:Uncharacterized protein n=1 Tax=Thalictrum thalictroides TaxID=46969 RepID=A0A7J6WKB7_THATH|nr:hypothetical protein FRX31_013025 [Thalictrum thalictroides]